MPETSIRRIRILKPGCSITIVARAQGDFLYDESGKKYLNFSESTNILGHRNPGIIGIISKYLEDGFIHYPLTVSFPRIAERVVEKMDRISGIDEGGYVFSSSGSEACDVAMSIMSELGPVITVEGGYPGNTGQFIRKKEIDRSIYGYDFEIPFPSSNSVLSNMEAMIRRGAKSVMLEPLQVEGGFRKVYDGFLSDIRRNFPELVICVDECYTGFGKTGRFFSYQWFGVKPDIVVVGKAIGGGLPLGLTIINDEVNSKSSVSRIFRNGAFGSSAGNVLALNVADYVISAVSAGEFLSEVERKGELFESITGDIFKERLRGMGLVRGIGFGSKTQASEFSRSLLNKGVFATSMGDAVRLSPPLNISEENLTMGIKETESSL
ncbi:MAG: aminotransferase class III-fold pyridoxal phosphate-dependent enzyme [Thermoplasmata archaeon]